MKRCDLFNEFTSFFHNRPTAVKVPTRNCRFVKCKSRNCHEKKVPHRIAESSKYIKMHEKMHKHRCEPCLLILKTQREAEDHQKNAHRIRCKVKNCKKYFLKDIEGKQHSLEESIKTHFEAKHKDLNYKNYL